jgi:hypothetical protein
MRAAGAAGLQFYRLWLGECTVDRPAASARLMDIGRTVYA